MESDQIRHEATEKTAPEPNNERSSSEQSASEHLEGEKSPPSIKSSEDVAKQITLEEKFPTKLIEDKSGIFVDYNPISAIAKLSNISAMPSLQRLTYVKHLGMILKELGEQGIGLLKKLFDDVMKDKDDVKAALLKQVPALITYIESLQQPYQRMKQFIIPLLVNFLYNTQLNIKQEAGQYLAAVSHKLDDKDRGECVLKYVIEMAHDDSNEDNRIVAVQLFSKMADSFGKDLCQQFIGLQLLSLGEDSHLKVRQEAIINLPIISKEVSPAFFKNRFFRFYQKKSGESHWGIRKSCVDIIIDIAKICDDVTRQTALTEIMLSFIKDTHKWVKISAFKSLGPFIASLKGRAIHPQLIQSFQKMATHEINDLSLQNEIFYACAYNFPAVIYTLGQSSWQTLYPTYQRLLKIPDKKVKKTIANSLHEIARIIGQQNTRNYLFNILDIFLKDSSKCVIKPDDEIKLGAIQNLCSIIQILDEQKRQQLVDIFQVLQKDQKKWRIRESIALQLTTLSRIYPIEMVFTYIVPMAFKFCNDTVSIVREEAATKIGDIVQVFASKPEGEMFLPAIIENIKGFSNSKKYTQRQTFAMMCETLVDQPDIFEQHFLKILQQLAKDKVTNVRIAVAKVVRRIELAKGKLWDNKTIRELYDLLSKDSSQDVTDLFNES